MKSSPEDDARGHYDVLILGAGAAGLCAACELAHAGCAVMVLEARDRIGGRIWTRFEPGFPYPIELGAEFIHGDAPVTTELMRAAGLVAVDTAGRRLTRSEGGAGRRQEDFDAVYCLMERARSLPQDLSVDQFLRLHAAEISSEAVAALRRMAEGFDAADLQRASAKALAEEWSGASLHGQSRPLGGYAVLMAYLGQSLDSRCAAIRLGTVIETVTWGRRCVKVITRGPSGVHAISARRAIVALPVSLLQRQSAAAGAVVFEPPLEAKQGALRGLAVGSVIKVVLRFRDAFWERLEGGTLADVGFMHASATMFATAWTHLPFRVPLLTAWMGGPGAQRLAGAAPAELIDRALDSVQRMIGEGTEARDQFAAGYVHDWSADRFARGAYGYLTVGGMGAPDALAEPLDDTLYFAGDAVGGSGIGTVEAALQSGRRAARAILACTE